jgi:hypothetical protein
VRLRGFTVPDVLLAAVGHETHRTGKISRAATRALLKDDIYRLSVFYGFNCMLILLSVCC